MNEQQQSRMEHSERLISAHLYLMRKPETHTKRIKKRIQSLFITLDVKLGEYADKAWDLINKSMQP